MSKKYSLSEIFQKYDPAMEKGNIELYHMHYKELMILFEKFGIKDYLEFFKENGEYIFDEEESELLVEILKESSGKLRKFRTNKNYDADISYINNVAARLFNMFDRRSKSNEELTLDKLSEIITKIADTIKLIEIDCSLKIKKISLEIQMLLQTGISDINNPNTVLKRSDIQEWFQALEQDYSFLKDKWGSVYESVQGFRSEMIRRRELGLDDDSDDVSSKYLVASYAEEIDNDKKFLS